MIKTNKILKFLATLIIFCIIINIMPCVTNAFEYKHWKAMKEGDVIYFDNTDLNWENVYIYIWNSNTEKPYKLWEQADAMTKVSDNIYSYTVTSDAANGSYDMLIFKNGKDGNENQTIDLGFIEAGFVYKIDKYEGDKRIGYWYLYDNSEINKHLNNAKVYQQDKKYYTEESYGNLDELILKAIEQADEEFILYCDNGIDYYLKIEDLLDKIDQLTNNLVVDTTILSDKITSEEKELDDTADKYTEESVKDLQDALDKAKELLEKDDITVDELKKELEVIEKADENLQLKPQEDKGQTGSDPNTNNPSTNEKDNNTGTTNETEGTNQQNTNAPSASDTSNGSNSSSNSNGSNVSNNSNSSNSSDTPKTGDNIVLDVVGLVLGVAGIIVIIVIRKNKLFNRK